MDQDKFQKFLDGTFEPARQNYKKRAMANQQSYRWLLWSITILSFISAVAVSWEAFFDWLPLKITAATISILVSALAATLKSFGFQEKSALYNRFRNELDSEWDFYQVGANDYAKAEDPEKYFVTRIRLFINEATISTPDMTVPSNP